MKYRHESLPVISNATTLDEIRDGEMYRLKAISVAPYRRFSRLGFTQHLVIKAATPQFESSFETLVRGNTEDFANNVVRISSELERDAEALAAEYPEIACHLDQNAAAVHLLLVARLQHDRLAATAEIAVPRTRFVLLVDNEGRVTPTTIQQRVAGTSLLSIADDDTLTTEQAYMVLKRIAPRIETLRRSELSQHINWFADNFLYDPASDVLHYVDTKATCLLHAGVNQSNAESYDAIFDRIRSRMPAIRKRTLRQSKPQKEVRTSTHIGPRSLPSLAARKRRRTQTLRNQFRTPRLEPLEERNLLAVLLSDNFNTTSFNSNWSFTDASIRPDNGSDGPKGPLPSASNAVQMHAFDDNLHSKTINLAGYDNATLYHWNQAGGHENPPESSDHLRLEYWNGSSWVEFGGYSWGGSGSSSWSSKSNSLPTAALHSNFQFRFQTFDSDTISCGFLGLSTCPGDYWFIDNVRLEATPDDDTSGPAITLNKGSSSDGGNNYLSWSISDPSGISSRSVVIKKNGSTIATPSGDSGTYDLNSLGLGDYSISVSATDNDSERGAADRSSSSKSLSVTVTDDDTSAPNISLSGSSGTEYGEDTQQFGWSVSDASGFQSLDVTVKRDGSTVHTSSSSSGSFNFDNLGAGTYTIQVSATDNDNDWSGDRRSSSASRTVVVKPDLAITMDADGNLVVDDARSGGGDNELSIRYDAANGEFVFTSSEQRFSSAHGTGGGSSTVRVPVADFTGNIIVNGKDGDDDVSVDLTNPLPRTITFHGGGQATADGDVLSVSGGSYTNGTFTYDGLDSMGAGTGFDGSLNYDGSMIHYTGLEPISSTINLTNVTLNYSAAAETITVTDAGGGSTTVTSTAGELTTFPNPSNNLTINPGDTGANTINLNSFTGTNTNVNIFDSTATNTLTVVGAVSAENVNFDADSITVNASLTAVATVDLNATASTISGSGKLNGVGAVLNAVSGINIDTNVSSVNANLSAAGDIDIDEDNALSASASTVSGNILIDAGGQLSANSVVAGGSGDITLTTSAGHIVVGAAIFAISDDVTLNAAGSIQAPAPDGVANVDGRNVTLTASGAIGGGAAAPLEVDAFGGPSNGLIVSSTGGGDIDVFDPDNTLRVRSATTTGDIRITADDGNMNVESVNGDIVRLQSNDGSLVDGNDAATNVTATTANLRASVSVGSVVDALETATPNLEGSATSGSFDVVNSGFTAINNAGVTAGSTVTITASSPLVVVSDVTAAGDITLTATDSAAAGDDLTVLAGVTVQSTGGDVNLRGGDDIELRTTSIINANGAVNISGDFGDADPTTGTTIDLLGRIISGSQATVTGNADSDTITIDPNAASFGAGVSVNGEGGDDSYVVQLGNLGGTVSINDDAGEGNDDLTVEGKAGVDTLNINAAGVSGDGETITYTANLEDLTVNSNDGADVLTVAPSTTLNIDVNGGDPSGVSPGDTLNFATPAGETATVTNQTADSGTVQTTGGSLDVDYDEIETLNFGGALVVDGTAEDDLLEVVATGAAAGQFRLTSDVNGDNGGPVVGPWINFVGLTSLTFNAGADNDIMQIDNQAGGVLAPTGGITFNGGADNDLLINRGGAATSGSYTVGPTADAGTITNDAQTINFTGLEPVEDLVATTNFTINASSGADTVNVIDDVLGSDGVTQRMQVNFNGAFELINFGNKTNVTVDSDADADTVNVDFATAASGLATLTIDAGGDADIINSLQNVVPLTINGEGGADTINISSNAPTNTGTLDDVDALITVNGDGGADVLNVSDSGDATGRVGTLSSTSLTGLGMTGGVSYSSISNINVDLGSMADTFNVVSLTADLTLDTGAGSDTINIGSAGDSLSPISGDITLDGEAHAAGSTSLTIKTGTNTLDSGDVLNLDDQGQAGVFTYDLSATTFTRSGSGTLTYSNIETLNLNTAIGSADINVASTADSVNTTINAQGGGEDIDVATTGDSASVVINAGGGADNVDFVTTGDGAFVQVNGAGGADNVTLQGTGATSAHVQLNGQGGTDTINVETTDSSSIVDITGGGNTDTINIGSPADLLAGVLGTICIEGDTHDAGTIDLDIKGVTNTLDTGDILNLNDQGDAGGFTYTLTATTFTRTGTGTIDYGTIETLNLNTSTGAADVDINTTAASVNTNVTTQGAADDIDVTTTGASSNVIINAGGGNDDIDIATTGVDSHTRVNGGAGSDQMDVAGQGAGARIGLFGEADTDNFTLTGSGTLLSGVIDGGSDDDTLDFSAFTDTISITLQALGAIDGFDGIEGDGTTGAINGCFQNIDLIVGTGNADDTLIMGADLPTHWDLEGTDDGQLIVSDASERGKPTTLPLTPGGGQEDLQWDDFENLVGAATANDRFDLRDGAGLTGSIDGRGGNDTIDYRDFTTDITVSLEAGTATNIGGGLVAGVGGDVDSSIENVYGGDGDDNITGDEDDNILGDGFGDDNLFGRPGDDVFFLEPDAANGSNDNLTDISGDDTVDFSCATESIMIDMDLLDTPMDVMMAAGNQFVTLNSNPTALEFSNFENVIGSQFNGDIFYVDALARDGDVPTFGPPVSRTVNGNTPHGVGDTDRLYFDGQGQVVQQTSLSVSIPGVGTVNHISVGEVIIYNQRPLIIDNGSLGFDLEPDPINTSTAWTLVPGSIGPNALNGSVEDKKRATWTGNLAPGAYRVSVTYQNDPLQATNARYTISDGVHQIGVVEVDQTGPANDFRYLDANWETLGVFNTVDGVLEVQLTNSPTGRVFADAVMFEPVGPGPELTVLIDGDQLLTDSGLATEFNTTLNNDQTRLVTVRNDGTSNLEISDIQLTPTPSTPFSITPPSFPLTLTPGQSIDFPITFAAGNHGEFEVGLQIVSNDVDENVITKPGAGTLPPLFDQDPFVTPLIGRVDNVSIIDNGDVGFSLSGEWLGPDQDGFQGDDRWNTADADGDSAEWSFTNLPNDNYGVSVTWDTSLGGNLTNTQFEVFDGTTLINTFSVDQTLTPESQAGGFLDRGVGWFPLGTALLTTGNLRVVLTDVNAGNGTQAITADAVRIERLVETELQLLDLGNGSVVVPDDTGVINLGDTNPFNPVNRTLRMQNPASSTNTVRVNEPTAPTGYAVASFDGLPPTGALFVDLAPGQFVDVQLQLLAGWPGEVGGRLEFPIQELPLNPINDLPNNPYDVQLQATVLGKQIIDNSDGGPQFQTVGDWQGPNGDGFRGNDLWHDGPGSATWTFTGLDPNILYAVSGTWHAEPARNDAAGSAFAVMHNGGTTNLLINQRLAPSTFQHLDISWESFGRFQPNALGELSITLTDPNPGNNEPVTADAFQVMPVAAGGLRVLQGGVPVQQGQVIDFGTTMVGTPSNVTLVLENSGQVPLPLGPLDLGPGFNLVGPPPTLIPPAVGGVPGTLNLQLQLPAVTPGGYASPLTVLHGDPLLPPLELMLQGQVIGAGTVIDNGDAGYTPGADFQQFVTQGFQNDLQFARDTGDVATWTFDLATLGLPLNSPYRVSMTWAEQGNRQEAAAVRILNGATPVWTGTLDQTQAPNDFLDLGVGWEDLENVFANSMLTVEISSTDAQQFVIADAVRIAPIVTPEMDLFNGAAQVLDQSGVVNFGSTQPGTPVPVTLTISNPGGAALPLQQPILPLGFSLLAPLPATVPAGGTVNFTLQMDAVLEGPKEGEVVIPNGDPNETPYLFSVVGFVGDPVAVIDNRDVGFTQSGFTQYLGQGFMNDVDFSLAGGGADTATFSWTAPQNGAFLVSATWPAEGNRATNTPFDLRLNGVSVGSSTQNQQLAPNDFTSLGRAWENLGVINASSGDTLSVVVADGTDGAAIADAIRFALITTPEIDVQDGATSLVDGASTVDFGATSLSVPVSKTFTITNQGGATLTLAAPTIPAGFSLTTPLSSTSLAPGASATFTVSMDASAVGPISGTVSVGNNDADEAPFEFDVRGEVTASGALVIDDGDAGFSATGFSFWSGGYQNDFQYSGGDNTGDTATWTFTGLASGRYAVATTWRAEANRATDAPFSVYDGAAIPANLLDTQDLNQQVGPNDFSEDGVFWEELVGSFNVTSGTLTVTLTDDADNFVIADAVRVIRLPNEEIQLTDSGTLVPDELGELDFGTLLTLQQTTKTITITNTGESTLTLSALPTVTGGAFTLTPAFAAGDTLASNASTTVDVTFNPGAAPGSFSETITLANSDSDENPYNFTVTGSAEATLIIDNFDSAGGFSQSGFTAFSGGFQGHFHYAAADSNGDTATWTFTNMLAGNYRVSTTWVEDPNRATDATFTITPGGSSATFNQQLPPDDFPDMGVNWEDIDAAFNLAADGSIVVTLTDTASNGFVIADAIRLEYLGPLMAADGARDSGAAELSAAEAVPVVEAAISRLSQNDPAAAARLANIDVMVRDLPGDALGLAAVWSRTIMIDSTAAGHGWSIHTGSSLDSMDLLTVVAHELNHLLGARDLDPASHANDLMSATLPTGAIRFEAQASLPGAIGAGAFWRVLDMHLAERRTTTELDRVLLGEELLDELLANPLDVHERVDDRVLRSIVTQETDVDIVDDLFAEFDVDDLEKTAD